jgi:hypothetical protein
MEGVALMKKYGANKWLSDDRNNPVLSKEDMDWGAVNWFPACVEAGWKYWAIILPEKVLGQINMEKLIKQYSDQGIITQIFSDPDKATIWLESVS